MVKKKKVVLGGSKGPHNSEEQLAAEAALVEKAKDILGKHIIQGVLDDDSSSAPPPPPAPQPSPEADMAPKPQETPSPPPAPVPQKSPPTKAPSRKRGAPLSRVESARLQVLEMREKEVRSAYSAARDQAERARLEASTRIQREASEKSRQPKGEFDRGLVDLRTLRSKKMAVLEQEYQRGLDDLHAKKAEQLNALEEEMRGLLELVEEEYQANLQAAETKLQSILGPLNTEKNQLLG